MTNSSESNDITSGWNKVFEYRCEEVNMFPDIRYSKNWIIRTDPRIIEMNGYGREPEVGHSLLLTLNFKFKRKRRGF